MRSKEASEPQQTLIASKRVLGHPANCATAAQDSRAAVADVPGKAQQCGGVGERADDVGAAFDLFVDALQWVRGPDPTPVCDVKPSPRLSVALSHRRC